MFKKGLFLVNAIAMSVTASLSGHAFSAEKVKLNGLNRDLVSASKTLSAASAASNPAALVNLSGSDSLQIRKSYQSTKGKSVVRYRQMYRGLPVLGDDIILAYNAENKLSHAHGAAVYGVGADLADITPSFSRDEVMARAKQISTDRALAEKSLSKGKAAVYENERNELAIWLDSANKARLVYSLSFVQHTDSPSRPTYIIDAKTGEELSYMDNLQHVDATGPGGNLKTGEYQYGTDFSFLEVTQSGTTCTMENANVRSVNLNHGTSGSAAYSFTCPENTFQEINGAFSPINDAHHFGGVVYDMYNDYVGVPPLDFQLRMRVHYLSNYENAFWDGTSMTFGDGFSFFYPLVSLDVSAHEVSHGFTEQNSNLIYANKSGGLNEAFSDMAGEAAEFYNYGTNDWQVGADIFKEEGALRYMDNPPLDGISIDHQDDYFSGMDVHYSSGVYNKAFYNLATTSGWDTQMAFSVYANANMLYWTADTNWDDAGNGVVDAACDMSLNTDDVIASLAAVGITSSLSAGRTCDGSSPVNQAPSADFSFSANQLMVDFSDSSSDSDGSVATWSWDFGDGNTSTLQNPSNTFAAGGSYDVTLTVTDDEGAADSSTQTVSVSDAVITSGGFTETDLSPGQSEMLSFTIDVPAGATSLDIGISGGTGNADLAVRFGSSPSRTLNDCFETGAGNSHSCSFSNPAVGTWFILVRGASASTGVQLDAYWNALAAENVAPSADFSFGSTNLETAFTDSSSDSDGTLASWSWDFGDGNASSTQNPVHTYAAAGDYSVTLTVSDDEGASGSNTQTVTVSEGGGSSSGGFTETGISPFQGSNVIYTIDVPAGASSLVIGTSGGTGNVDLGLNFASTPTRTNSDCLQTGNGNAHTCTISNPAPGTWFILIRAAATSSDVQLDAYWYID
jgi:vibriolysin